MAPLYPAALRGGGQADRVGYVEHLEDDVGARCDDGLGVGGVIGGADLRNGRPFIDDIRAGGLETAAASSRAATPGATFSTIRAIRNWRKLLTPTMSSNTCSPPAVARHVQ